MAAEALALFALGDRCQCETGFQPLGLRPEARLPIGPAQIGRQRINGDMTLRTQTIGVTQLKQAAIEIIARRAAHLLPAD